MFIVWGSKTFKQLFEWLEHSTLFIVHEPWKEGFKPKVQDDLKWVYSHLKMACRTEEMGLDSLPGHSPTGSHGGRTEACNTSHRAPRPAAWNGWHSSQPLDLEPPHTDTHKNTHTHTRDGGNCSFLWSHTQWSVSQLQTVWREIRDTTLPLRAVLQFVSLSSKEVPVGLGLSSCPQQWAFQIRRNREIVLTGTQMDKRSVPKRFGFRVTNGHLHLRACLSCSGWGQPPSESNLFQQPELVILSFQSFPGIPSKEFLLVHGHELLQNYHTLKLGGPTRVPFLNLTSGKSRSTVPQSGRKRDCSF